MGRSRTETVLVTKVTGLPGGEAADPTSMRRQPDEVIVEEPMSIQLDGTLVATTMRTPGHDYELAVGFCFSDGLLQGAAVTGVRYCATGPASESDFNVVTVETGGMAPPPTPRLGTTSSSCGLCGSATLAELCDRLQPIAPDRAASFSVDLLAEIPTRVQASQALFASTGAVHAAAAFSEAGEVVLTREDVGRHNAVDKVVGRLLLEGGLPAHRLGLYVSGRASYEIVQKAWAAGFAAVVAVSAPTALAVETARAAGMLLAGFARAEQLNVYAPERVA
jgi:FdhD protein